MFDPDAAKPMNCPAERFESIEKLLETGIRRFRALGPGGRAAPSAVEADRIPNRPALPTDFSAERLASDRSVDREAYPEQALQDRCPTSEPLGERLGSHVSAASVPVPPPAGMRRP
jgi:hypothetical protein